MALAAIDGLIDMIESQAKSNTAANDEKAQELTESNDEIIPGNKVVVITGASVALDPVTRFNQISH